MASKTSPSRVPCFAQSAICRVLLLSSKLECCWLYVRSHYVFPALLAQQRSASIPNTQMFPVVQTFRKTVTTFLACNPCTLQLAALRAAGTLVNNTSRLDSLFVPYRLNAIPQYLPCSVLSKHFGFNLGNEIAVTSATHHL